LDDPQIERQVNDLVSRARDAQAEAGTWDQDRVDDVVAAVGWQCYREDNSRRLADLSYAETRLGNVAHLYDTHRRRVLGVSRDMRRQATVGVVEEAPDLGIRRLAKPVGVVAVASPTTAPSTGIVCNVLPILKTRNAAIVTPNPRARRVATATIDLIRKALSGAGAPADLVQHFEIPGREATQRLMAAADLVVATGGPGTTRRAYTSGTPAIAAGVGNPTIIVDETADISLAARTIQFGASYNNGTSCSSESNVLVHRSVFEEFLAELRRNGAHVCADDEAMRVCGALWPDGRALDRGLIGLSANEIALAADVKTDLGDETTLLVVPCADPRLDSPLLWEKLSPVLTVSTFESFDEAVDLTRTVLDRCGRGHSCGIHTTRANRVAALADAVPAVRVVVNQSTITNTGSFDNGVPFTTILPSGTWGGCSLSENVTWRHFLNYTTISWTTEKRVPDEAVIFGAHRK
jgi:sulfoacetaldehyde dehydrogenase